MAVEPTPKHPPTIGPYTLVGVIGRGGMGSVYDGIGPDGRAVAVKVMHGGRRASPRVAARFAREATIRVEHPAIVQVLDAGTTERGDPWIAFERLRGRTVADRLQTGPLTLPESIAIASAVCDGLAAAHRVGVVHRDVKPTNVVLCDDGQVKLIDFGIAFIRDSERLTEPGAALGTAGYQSPEQAKGEPTSAVATDVWGIGSLLYAMVSGRCAFDRGTAVATMFAVVLDDPQPLEGVPELWAIVEACLRKDPAERWSSADDVARALRALSIDDGREAVAPPPPISTDERRIVAVLVAEGVSDYALLRGAVERGGGVLVALRDQRAVGVFGGQAWAGDEVVCAAEAALAARPAVARVGVGSGRALSSEGAVSGEAVRAAERACAAGAQGVAVAVRSTRGVESRLRGVALDD